MLGDSGLVGAIVSRSSEGVDPQERTRMLAEQRREREFEVCVRGEHQIVDDGAVDEATACVKAVQS